MIVSACKLIETDANVRQISFRKLLVSGKQLSCVSSVRCTLEANKETEFIPLKLKAEAKILGCDVQLDLYPMFLQIEREEDKSIIYGDFTFDPITIDIDVRVEDDKLLTELIKDMNLVLDTDTNEVSLGRRSISIKIDRENPKAISKYLVMKDFTLIINGMQHKIRVKETKITNDIEQFVLELLI